MKSLASCDTSDDVYTVCSSRHQVPVAKATPPFKGKNFLFTKQEKQENSEKLLTSRFDPQLLRSACRSGLGPAAEL